MKNSGLFNPFSHQTRLLYMYVFACFNCGQSNRGIELHHIFGRETNSPFNACPLCRYCHSMVTNSEEERAFFFFKNQEFLIENHYKPNEKDYELIEKHPFLVKSREFSRVYGKK